MAETRSQDSRQKKSRRDLTQNVNKSQLKLFKDIATLPCQAQESGSDITRLSRDSAQIETLSKNLRNLKIGHTTDMQLPVAEDKPIKQLKQAVSNTRIDKRPVDL